jgi:hypothetical protein
MDCELDLGYVHRPVVAAQAVLDKDSNSGGKPAGSLRATPSGN